MLPCEGTRRRCASLLPVLPSFRTLAVKTFEVGGAGSAGAVTRVFVDCDCSLHTPNEDI